MKQAAFFVFFLLIAFNAIGQRKCATVEVNQLGKSQDQILKETEAFEKWLIDKKSTLRQANALQETNETTIYKIPVVVHIIHNGEAYGVGNNITDEQIYSQIEVLNRDFRRLNPDSINTPSYFQPVAADIGFEFELAKRDPNGLSSDGITRTTGSKDAWTLNDNIELKAHSYWSSTDYLNIWIAPLIGYYGWAEYPTSDILDGVNSEATNNPITDGIVIDPKAFGSAEIYPPGNYFNYINLGRTATHEIGHFFGLRHIWGDGGCSVDDYVVDTPNTSQSYGSFTSSCPPADTHQYSCDDEPTMFMNYMEYVNDECMNLFSLGQKERMVIIVNNSPRRASLLTSPALEAPPPFDAAITAIPSPDFGICKNQIFPTVTILNNGQGDILEIEIGFSVNGIEVVNETFSLTLTTGNEEILNLPGFVQTEYGNMDLVATIKSVNGTQDDIPDNNSFTKQAFYGEAVNQLNESFTSWPESWAVRTEAPISNWNSTQAPNLIITNTAAVLGYYDVPSSAPDYLISPILDLSTFTSPYFLFDYAYGRREDLDDLLTVVVSTDCGNNFTDTLFYKSGQQLSTTKVPVSFTPSGQADWRTSVINLSDYENQSIQVAFVGESFGGNNIYLDNIMLKEQGYTDLELMGLANESGAYAHDVEYVGLKIENKGTTVIDSISIAYFEDAIKIGTQSIGRISLEPGTREIIPILNKYATGTHNIQFTSMIEDDNPDNDSFSSNSNFISTSYLIPFRERFENNSWINSGQWTITSPNDTQVWKEENNSVAYRSSLKGNSGLRDWLVLPLLDLSQALEASLEFKLAYSKNDIKNDALRVQLSTNNGMNYNHMLEELWDYKLVTNQNTDLQPHDKDDWRTIFIDISEFAGEKNILIAFESIDGDGGDIFVDDIELFVSSDQVTAEVENNSLAVYPNPITDLETYLSFNLEEKQDVSIRLLDMSGKLMAEAEYNNVLNQTFPFEISTNRNGIYILQTIGTNFIDIRRIMVSK